MDDDLTGLVLVLPAALLAVGALVVRWAVRAAVDGRLPPNHVAGMRTSATMASPEAWQAGHRAARPWTDGSAAVALVLAGAAVVLGVADAGTAWTAGAILAGAGALLVGAVGGGVAAHRVASRMRTER